MLDGFCDQGRVCHFTVADRAGGKRHLAKALQGHRALAERQLGGAHTGRTDVEPNRSSSCHWFVLLCESLNRDADYVSVGVVRDEIGRNSGVLEHMGDADCAGRLRK